VIVVVLQILVNSHPNETCETVGAKKREKVSPSEAEINNAQRAKILVVDDESVVRQLLGEELTEEGHHVDTAESAGTALYRIQNVRYDLILLDIKLRGMSGIELYRLMEKMPQSLIDRIIFITGDVMGTDTQKFLSETEAPYISKPFNMEQLNKEINHILDQRT
jgi:CheY-like chemotaxis protein